MPTDTIRRTANLLLASGQLVVPPILFSGGFDATSAKLPIAAEPNPATPAGYAFAIWGAIYIGAMIYAVVQALPRTRHLPIFSAIGWHTVLGYGACCAWLFFARFGPVWLTVPIIAIMLLTIGRAFALSADAFHADKSLPHLLTAVPLTLYAGWLSAATFVNAADVLPGYGFNRFGLRAEGFGRLTVLLAAGTSMVLSWRTQAFPVYIGTVIWALVGIMVSNGGMRFANSIPLVCLAAIVLLIGCAIFFRPTRRAHGPLLRRPVPEV